MMLALLKRENLKIQFVILLIETIVLVIGYLLNIDSDIVTQILQLLDIIFYNIDSIKVFLLKLQILTMQFKILAKNK